MRQRKAKAKRRKLAMGHPRDPRHPEHAQWVEKMREVQNKRWASMTEAQRAEQERKMQKGRKKVA